MMKNVTTFEVCCRTLERVSRHETYRFVIFYILHHTPV